MFQTGHLSKKIYLLQWVSEWAVMQTHLQKNARGHLENQRCSMCPGQQSNYWKMCPVNLLQITTNLPPATFEYSLCLSDSFAAFAILLTIWSSKGNFAWSSQLFLHTSKRCTCIIQENYFPALHGVIYFSLMSGWIECSVLATDCRSFLFVLSNKKKCLLRGLFFTFSWDKNTDCWTVVSA